MPGAAMLDAGRGERQVDRLLAAARDAIADVPICWVATPTEDGRAANARAVRDCTGDGGADAWTRWFLARPDSRKAAEIRRTGRATLAYQHGSGTAFVALCGRAELVADRREVEARLRRTVDDPDGSLAAKLVAVRVTLLERGPDGAWRLKLVAVRVTTDRVEVHIRGLTAEPWGQGRTLLERGPDGAWRLLPD